MKKLLGGLLTGIILLYGSAFAAESKKQRSFNQSPLNLIFYPATFCSLNILGTLVHETGHALAYYAFFKKVVPISIGGLGSQALWENAYLRIVGFNLQGYVTIPPEPYRQDDLPKLAIIAAAGPLTCMAFNYVVQKSIQAQEAYSTEKNVVKSIKKAWSTSLLEDMCVSKLNLGLIAKVTLFSRSICLAPLNLIPDFEGSDGHYINTLYPKYRKCLYDSVIGAALAFGCYKGFQYIVREQKAILTETKADYTQGYRSMLTLPYDDC